MTIERDAIRQAKPLRNELARLQSFAEAANTIWPEDSPAKEARCRAMLAESMALVPDRESKRNASLRPKILAVLFASGVALSKADVEERLRADDPTVNAASIGSALSKLVAEGRIVKSRSKYKAKTMEPQSATPSAGRLQ